MQNTGRKISAAFFVLTAALLFTNQIFAQEKTTAPAPETKPNVIQPLGDFNQPFDENKRYRIGVNDEVEISVFKHPEYSLTVRISENGLIPLPRVEQPVYAVCKSENELAAEITERYKKILRQPFVRVTVRNYQSQPVAVIGAVEKAGQLYLNRRMRLMQVVALAGGPNKEAGTRIQLARLGTANACEKPAEAAPAEEKDLSQLLYSFSLKKTLEGDEAANPWMQPGDLVYVSEADKAFVVGNVKEQKTILLKTPRTVTQAIAEAGGLEAASKKREVVIIRSDEAGNKTKIPVDLIAIAERKQEDPFLKPNDIIEVPTDGKKQVRNNILKAFTQGLPSVLPFLF